MRLVNVSLTLLLAILFIPVAPVRAGDGDISEQMIRQFRASVSSDKSLAATINAVTNNDIKALSLNRDLITKHDSRFNVEVKGSGIVDQRSSGRCWMFAGANTITPKLVHKLDLSEFELSEAYLAFWDKMEKSNHFLEIMIELRDRPIDDRSLQMYLEGPLGDGGWWHYFTGLIQKYGIVPASAMPETRQSSSTSTINNLLNSLLRKAASELRDMHKRGRPVRDLRGTKLAYLSDIFHLLVTAYGLPPQEFTFRYETEVDSVKTLAEQTYTPATFFGEFYENGMPEYVAIVHNPTLDYDKLYRLENSRNILEQTDLTVLNLPIQRLKDYTYRSLIDSQFVWFACDVGKDNYNDSGMFAVKIYDYQRSLGIDFALSKEDRIRYHDMTPNHAMVFTGVDTTSDGIPRKWLVENSWGKKRGKDGMWTMYDGWFDEYVLLVIVDKARLDPADQLKFSQDPIPVADWEPFFSQLQRLK